MDSPLPLYVPILEEHWRRNSLYGFLEAAGRFNLCSAWEMSRLVDGWAERVFELRPPPKVANLAAFMAWATTCDVESITSDRQALRIVVEVAKRDAREVGLGWLVPWLKWCPICADSQTHRAVHQHKAIVYCPDHGVRLLTQCAYCAASSPYRVQRSSGLFKCTHCGEPVGGTDRAMATIFHSHVREDAASPEHINVRQRGEGVIVPGLPRCTHILPAGTRRESMAQDLHILFGERALEPRLRSESSKTLGHYFRFTDPQPTPKAITPSHVDYDRGVLSVLQQAGTLALLAGHACVQDLASHDSADHRDCPCGVGFRVWKKRMSFDEFRASCVRCEGVRSDDFEASHLGLCLSMAWFSSAQASCVDDPTLYQSLIGFLGPRIGGFWSDAKMGRVAMLDYRFQWFAVPCVHGSRRLLRRLRQYESAARASQSGVTSILDVTQRLTSESDPNGLASLQHH